jgi:hypothetical protein
VFLAKEKTDSEALAPPHRKGFASTFFVTVTA